MSVAPHRGDFRRREAWGENQTLPKGPTSSATTLHLGLGGGVSDACPPAQPAAAATTRFLGDETGPSSAWRVAIPSTEKSFFFFSRCELLPLPIIKIEI